MTKHLVVVHITIEAEDAECAVQDIGQFMSAALVGEPSPIIDYSVEAVIESWDDLSQEVIDEFIPEQKEPVQLSFNFEKECG